MLLCEHPGGQGVRRIAFHYWHHGLCQDWAVIKICCHLMHGGTRELTACFVCRPAKAGNSEG